MKLTSNRRAKLALFKILEYAEIGGLTPGDCGAIYEAVSNCLDAIGKDEGDETTISGLIDQIQQILTAEEWKQQVT